MSDNVKIMKNYSHQESSDGRNKGSIVSLILPYVLLLENIFKLLNESENAQVHQNLKDHQVAQHTGIVEVLERREDNWVGLIYLCPMTHMGHTSACIMMSPDRER